MKTSDAIMLQQLLNIARGNIGGARTQLRNVAWSTDTLPLSSTLSLTLLALEQTINALDKVLEDLK